MANKRVVHLRDERQPARAVCGVRPGLQFLTALGWKVTCEVCNPPTRRKVRVKPRPAPVSPELEDA